MQVFVRHGGGADGAAAEWLILELQGTVQARGEVPLDRLPLGQLNLREGKVRMCAHWLSPTSLELHFFAHVCPPPAHLLFPASLLLLTCCRPCRRPSCSLATISYWAKWSG